MFSLVFSSVDFAGSGTSLSQDLYPCLSMRHLVAVAQKCRVAETYRESICVPVECVLLPDFVHDVTGTVFQFDAQSCGLRSLMTCNGGAPQF